MKRTVLLCTVLLLVLGGLAVAQQQETSLGDVVRQHKPTKKAARVITNEDVPSRSDESPAPADPSPSAATATTDSTPDAKASDSKDAKTGAAADTSKDQKPKEDSAEVKALKTRLDQLNKDVENVQFSVKGMETQLANEEDAERRTILQNAIQSRTFSLQHTVLERDDTKAKLDELQKPKSE